MSTILFFDDWNLHRRENLARHIGQATLVHEGIFEDPYADPAWGYPRVYQDAETGRWRCYYQGQLTDSQLNRRRRVPLLAESDDGIHWEIPDLSDRVEISDRLCPHQLFDIERFGQWCGVYLDPNATGTDELYKGLVSEYTGAESGPRSSVVASPDGIHWRYLEGVRYNPFGIDPSAYPFWNPYRQSYVLALREHRGVRRIHVSETKDWRTFSDPEWALQPDALDTPCAEIYGMPVVPYEDMFVGLLWMFHTDPAVDAASKYLMGKIDCQLAYSLNGWHFQRTVREPLIANTAPGEHGSGCIYPSSAVIDGDTVRIYSSTSKGEHGQIQADPASRQAAIVLHTIRRDGFVYLEPEGGTGELITRLLRWKDGEPELNVSAPHGEARVQVMDGLGESIDGYRYEDCMPLESDSTAWTPVWGEGRKLAALGDRIIRLGVRLANGRLYAIRGDFEIQLVRPRP